MEPHNDKPIIQSYRAAERLYAGEYPGDKGQEKAMDKLKALDEVAYVRFASVYRQFKDINTFMDELAKLLGEK